MSVKCPNCKKKVEPDSLFCGGCGIRLGNSGELKSYGAQDSHTFIRNVIKEKYEIFELIGKGGMASVYRARQVNLDRLVALKIIHPNLIHDQEFVNRFLQEARLGARLSHPNIVRIYDFGEIGGIYYISMEYLDGSDLASIIRKQKKMDPQEALGFLTPIADALRYIHRKGLVHRDVKAANILVTQDGRPVLTDFGIAYAAGNSRLTVAGTLLGTPEYISPEQAGGGKAIPASDFYGLGVLLYEMISGRVPFTHSSAAMVINEILTREPEPIRKFCPRIPTDIESLVMGLLEKSPNTRGQAIQALTGRLTTDRIPSVRTNGSVSPREKRRITPRKNILLLALLVITLIGIAFSISLLLKPDSSPLGEIVPADDAPKSLGSQPAITEESSRVLPRTVSEDSRGYGEEVQSPWAKDTLNNQLLPSSPLSSRSVTELIEEQMRPFNGMMVMSEFVSERIWNLVMGAGPNLGDQPVRRISYNQVEEFLKRLNEISSNDNEYQLPSLSLIREALEAGMISSGMSEWVSDPPIFRGSRDPRYAKLYHLQFRDEAGERRNRTRSDITFRLIRRE